MSRTCKLCGDNVGPRLSFCDKCKAFKKKQNKHKYKAKSNRATICRIEGCGKPRDESITWAMCHDHYLEYYRHRNRSSSYNRPNEKLVPIKKLGYNASDIMHASPERAARMIDWLLRRGQ